MSKQIYKSKLLDEHRKGCLICLLVLFIGAIINFQSQIDDLPKEVCWNETETLDKLEFCIKLTNEIWIKELRDFDYFYDLCLNGSIYEDYVKYKKYYLIKSTKEVCEIK